MSEPQGPPNVVFIGLAKGSVLAGHAELAAKIAAGKVRHFLIITEDAAGNFEPYIWGESVNTDRLLRYSEELRLWANRANAEASTPRSVA